jgi:hypothetical protein
LIGATTERFRDEGAVLVGKVHFSNVDDIGFLNWLGTLFGEPPPPITYR